MLLSQIRSPKVPEIARIMKNQIGHERDLGKKEGITITIKLTKNFTTLKVTSRYLSPHHLTDAHINNLGRDMWKNMNKNIAEKRCVLQAINHFKESSMRLKMNYMTLRKLCFEFTKDYSKCSK